MQRRPYIVVIGGPNGAGKTTIARDVIERTFGIVEFVNADAIATGLAAFDPERAAFAAGRVMLVRLRELAAQRISFAFESTLASRTFVPWLANQRAAGYDIHFIYVALRTPDLARRRVKARVRKGGHDIPPETITRRFRRSAYNFLSLYRPLAQTWRLYDNSSRSPSLTAIGGHEQREQVFEPRLWKTLNEIAHTEAQEQQRSHPPHEGRQGD